MRWMKRGLYAFAGLIGLLAVGLAVDHWLETVQIEEYYANRPMLRAMRAAAPTAEQPKPRLQYVDILFERTPRGTNRDRVLEFLGSEDIECLPVAGPERNERMVCGVLGQKPVHDPNWHIELAFDPSDNLAGARVLALK